MKEERIIQILTVGYYGVGKTALIKRYDDNSFESKYLTTIMMDFISKQINIKDELVTLRIWDIGKRDGLVSISYSFYKQFEGILIVFDVTDDNSCEILSKRIMPDVRKHADVNTIMYLVGNKIDLRDERKISKEEGEEMAKKYEMKYFETSAKDNNNVVETIEGLGKEIYEKTPVKENHIKIASGQKEKTGRCK